MFSFQRKKYIEVTENDLFGVWIFVCDFSFGLSAKMFYLIYVFVEMIANEAFVYVRVFLCRFVIAAVYLIHSSSDFTLNDALGTKRTGTSCNYLSFSSGRFAGKSYLLRVCIFLSFVSQRSNRFGNLIN